MNPAPSLYSDAFQKLNNRIPFDIGYTDKNRKTALNRGEGAG